MSSNIIIGIVGLALSILAIYLCFKSAQTRKNGDEVIATITKMHRGKEHTNVFVTYEYCGQIYQDIKLGYYRTGFYPGKEISGYSCSWRMVMGCNWCIHRYSVNFCINKWLINLKTHCFSEKQWVFVI